MKLEGNSISFINVRVHELVSLCLWDWISGVLLRHNFWIDLIVIWNVGIYNLYPGLTFKVAHLLIFSKKETQYLTEKLYIFEQTKIHPNGAAG